MDIYVLHEKMTAHLFPAYSNTDERFLALALCGEAGELANLIKKRWRDGADLSEEVCDEIADIRVYLELIAKCFHIEGEKLDRRVEQKLVKVVEKHRARLWTEDQARRLNTECEADIARVHGS
jgi:NTP pyrophosphatase (non-canonical NTP hydrolase)